MNKDFKSVIYNGVSCEINKPHTIARFPNWQDASAATGHAIDAYGDLSEQITQNIFNSVYPALNSIKITRRKLSKSKVLFKDLNNPMAFDYKGAVYVVAPVMNPDDAPDIFYKDGDGVPKTGGD